MILKTPASCGTPAAFATTWHWWCNGGMLHALRFLYAILLLGIAAFAFFGFMATFEPSDHNIIMWRVGYVALASGALLAANCMAAGRPRARPRGRRGSPGLPHPVDPHLV